VRDTPQVRSKKAVIDGVGLSLLQLLQKEYGDEHREGRSVEEARRAMEEVNPLLAQRNPKDAIAALKTQFRAYLDGTEPFTRKRRRNESIREYWCQFLKDEDSDILAVRQHFLMGRISQSLPLNLGTCSKNFLSHAGFNG
jgi:hypothetical protein